MADLFKVIEISRPNPAGPYIETGLCSAISSSGGVADAGKLVVTGADGKIDASMAGAGVSVEVNGTPTPVQSTANFISGTNITITADGAGGITISASGSVATSFNNISSGTNTTGAMVVGTGASITTSGTGVIAATKLGTINVTSNIPSHEGQILISQPGNTSAVWADPLMQGLYPAGSDISSPPSFASPTTIQPVLVGGEGTDGNLYNLQTTTSGALIVVSEAQSASQFATNTGPNLVSISGALTPILSIRPQSGATTITFFLIGGDIFAAPAISMWQLLKSPTLTGASFANVSGTHAQVDTSATILSGGVMVDCGYTTLGTRVVTYQINFVIGDIYTLAVAGQGGNATQASGSLRWTEA